MSVHSSRWIRLTILMLALLGLGVAQTKESASSPQQLRQRGLLTLHVPVENEISGGQTDEYSVAVKASQFVRVVAEQKGVDVILSITDPTDSILVTSDTPNGRFGSEPASIIARVDGLYRVKVSVLSPSSFSGIYSLEVTDLRTSWERDATRIKAEKTLSDVAILLTDNSESPREAAEPLKQAARDFHQPGDEYEEGLSLHQLGSVYEDLDEKRKALEYYQQALPIQWAVGDRRGEAAPLIHLGLLYAAVGVSH